MKKITGSALLKLRDEMMAEGYKTAAIVREAGYIGTKKDGSERLHFTEFYEEILIARGVMWRISVNMAEITADGYQPIESHSFTTSSRNIRNISRKVRELTKLTRVKCKRVIENGKILLYPNHNDFVVSYNMPV